MRCSPIGVPRTQFGKQCDRLPVAYFIRRAFYAFIAGAYFILVKGRANYAMFVQNILERLDAGEIVIGDGGFVFALEKRGYVKAGPWTPEAAAEHPEAGKRYLIFGSLDPVHQS